MIYPDSFEHKIGFSEIRHLLKERCLSTLGREEVDHLSFSHDAETINEWLEQIREFRQVKEQEADFSLHDFHDMREALLRLRLENTHLEEKELFDLKRSLEVVNVIVDFFDTHPYPALYLLTEGVPTFPKVIVRIDQIIDKFGKIKDSASAELKRIRSELSATAGSISHTLMNILRQAQGEGLVEKDVTPTLRDGRLVIPVAPAMKRRISGIVHDESASGRTVFIEPTVVVEANNKVRELEAEERREIIRLLLEFSDSIRPYLSDMLESYRFLAVVDLLQAKASLAERFRCTEPQVDRHPHMDFLQAVHPLLALSLEKQGKQVVPLDIRLTPEQRMLIISGPNAGGKSVCLKTTGLLQYMLQCGLSIPVGERSTAGIFQNIMIDIGDEQSIEDDLSTYSSHLLNMKQMMRRADEDTLLLIDEFGSGTEPTIGGAIAQSVLKQFWKKRAWGIITTHYQNLKHFADDHEGIVNGAMLYDRHQMQALFQLSIGQPGSSFAIEIARKTGLPEEVISEASDIVGSEYVQSDKYLQDIVRDKRYWEGKRQTIHQREKDIERTIQRYEDNLTDIEQSRKEILRKAKEQAEELLRESNRRIENAIREIRESQAEKEETRRIRERLNAFKQELSDIDTKAEDEKIARKIAQLQARKERQEQRKKEKQQKKAAETDRQAETRKAPAEEPIAVGDSVRIKGLQSVGTVESINGKMAAVIFGEMRTKLRVERLEKAPAGVQPTSSKNAQRQEELASSRAQVSRETQKTIDDRKLNFRQDIDVRGMRGDEAIRAVTYFLDDAILVGMPRVRILHGKGNGILRQLIREYVATVPYVTHYADEHVQFGGAGITVVDLE